MTAAGLPAGAPLLSLRNLGKTFNLDRGWRGRRQLQVLRDVSFDVDAGEVVALVGESGSGKSTTALLIARLLDPTTGEIRLRGVDVLTSEPGRASLAYRRQVQMIFQDPFASLNPLHTIRYHLERPLLRHGEAKEKPELEQRVNRLLETVGLNPAPDFAQRHPHQLSGGQRQRVAIARALAVNPALIVADEPTSMLDVSLRIDLLNLMRDIKSARRIAYLFITHDLGSARYFADRLLVMYAGEIVETGGSEALLDAPAHPYTQLLVSSVPTAGAALNSAPTPGGVPAAAAPVLGRGCPFADRCPKVMERCRQEAPLLREIAAARAVRCHLYG
jgi:peptide/nickel transport system ATP-binding protein